HLPAAISSQVERSISLQTYRYLGPIRLSFGPTVVAKDWREQLTPLYELPAATAGETLPRLSERDPRFASDAEAFRAVASDPTWVIANWWAGKGGSVSLYGQSGPVTFKVAGSFAEGILDGVVGSRAALTPFVGSASGATFLVRARPGVEAGALAGEIQR